MKIQNYAIGTAYRTIVFRKMLYKFALLPVHCGCLIPLMFVSVCLQFVVEFSLFEKLNITIQF